MHLNAKESIVLPAIPDSILKATDFVDRLLDTLNCSAKGGEGEYTYTVSYKKQTSDKWTSAQYFKANNTVTLKPAAAVDYDICVKVKDAAGTIVKQYLTVNVTK